MNRTIHDIVQDKLDKQLAITRKQLETGWIDKAPTPEQLYQSILKLITTDPQNKGVSGWHIKQIKAELKQQLAATEVKSCHE